MPLLALSLLLASCGADLEGLIRKYLSDDPDVSGRAERELLVLGEEAVPALVDAFASATDREKLGRLLAELGPSAVEPLVGFVEGENVGLAADAAEVLAEMGEDAIGPLIEALKAGTDRPADIAATLGRIGKPAWAPMLELFDSTNDANLKGILAATFFTSGDTGLAEMLMPRIGDPELGDALLSAVVVHTPPDELAGEVDGETAWRILSFIPLEPLVGPVSELVPKLQEEIIEELGAMASSRREKSPFESNLVRMHLSGIAGEWSRAASHGSGPFETLVISYDVERANPGSADLLRVALLHHGGLYLMYLIDGAEALEPKEPERARRLAALAGEVTGVIEGLMAAPG